MGNCNKKWASTAALIALLGFGFLATGMGSVTLEPGLSAPAEEIRGVWMWASSVQEEGAEAIAKRLAQHRINRVFLLVKGYSGKLCYPSDVIPGAKSERDLLKEALQAFHARGIEVHAWYVFNSDNYWGKSHPDDIMHHAGDPRAWEKGPYSKNEDPSRLLICPLSAGYRSHFKAMVEEVLEKYAVDGIHLDYIRYGHVCYCFCPRHQARAASRGIDVAKVREAVYATYYAPRKDAELYFKLYRQGDKNIKEWVTMREEEITSAVKELRALVKSKRSTLALSAAFMPEGGRPDDAYALCHYAQNYATAGSELDYILPMTYWEPSPVVAQIALNAEKKSHRPVYSGLWAASERVAESESGRPTSPMATAPVLKLRNDLRIIQESGVKGFVLFRYGTITEELWKEILPGI
jgi:uncharacterized lipoprotein YddW (UPF0748 family)